MKCPFYVRNCLTGSFDEHQ